MTGERVRRRLRGLACGWTALICWHGHGAPALHADPPPEEALRRLAALQMERLQAPGAEVARWPKLSRYFAAYPLPTEEAEAGRLLGTARRILRSFAVRLYGAALERARHTGSAAVDAGHVTMALDELLPSAATPHKTRVFFPEAPPDLRVPVEIIDLEAFQDTPITWRALAELTLPPNEGPLADEEAARRFADGVGAYGLLLFRLGAACARQEYAPHLASPHLRKAHKEILRRRLESGSPPPAAGPGAGETPFTDVTAASGIDFRHVSSDWISRFRRYGPQAPTFSGGGVTAADLDGDSWPDLVYCGGEGCDAFRNRRNGTFEPLEGRGLDVPGEARMSVAADFDNDGDPDLFITYARDTNRLFRNRSGGRFNDVTPASGVERPGDISGPAIAFDYDNDGRLDLYVGNFGDYLAGASPWIVADPRNALPNRLYRNLGELRFEDTTGRAGAGDTGWTQAVSHLDYDLDGYQDIYVANDFGSNELLRNQGDGTFLPRGEETGTRDRFHGMNVALADLNQDRRADILVSNIWGWSPTTRAPGEFNSLFISEAQEDGAVHYRRDTRLIPDLVRRDTGWAWAALFFDLENDGDDDLFLLNGLTDYSTARQLRPHPERPGALYPVSNSREANLLFLNEGGRLKIPPGPSGAGLGRYNSRGLALLDHDRDGDLDMAVSTFHAEGRLFRNDSGAGTNHWLRVELKGDPARGASFDAIGARLIAHPAGGAQVWRAVTGGEGYLGMSTLPVDIGLGAAQQVDLEILWPGGRAQRLEGVAADQAIRVRQGTAGFERLY